jgi:hypothetical protein
VPAYPRAVAATFPLHHLLTLFSSGYDPGQGGFGQQPGFGTGGVNPYSNPPGVGAPPPRKSNSWIWILGIVGLLGIGMVVCCGIFGYYAFSQGMGMAANIAKEQVQGHPTIVEKFGEIESATMNFVKSTEETQKRGTGTNFFVIEVEGTNDQKGELIVEQARNPSGPDDMFSKIDLRMPGGEVISIK